MRKSSKCTLIAAISHINTLSEDRREQWEMAIAYLLLLILHRCPAGQHDRLKTVVDDHIPPSLREEVTDVVYSMANQLLDEGERRGREEGERKGIIESILALLGARFHPDAVQALKPAIEGIGDWQRLKECYSRHTIHKA